ncbi:spore germination protein YndE [Clostridium acetireducens DSM 10703]|uniref:Spore germination protein YndE n=1 Tax=Clostridium acetireducens DSM 10703 TaxID=1121290 RepID=A0A1E8EZP1_9CLOT|nr:endospore germination permease [Clostridium acetireducens]OFI06182.1 spore germination protein YndE [Clostridium acetireducens DSM 10703]
MDDKNYIGDYGVFASIVVAVIGVRVFSYPRELATIVENDAWIVSITNGILAILLFYMLCKIIEYNNYSDICSIYQNNLGNLLSKIALISLLYYLISYISLGLRVLVEEIKMYLLERTPTEFIIICMILVGVYIVRLELETIVKFNEIAFLLMFIPAIFIFLFSFNETDFSNLLPILNNTTKNYFKATRYTLGRFSGIEIIFLLLPFMKNKKNIKKVGTMSISFITVFYFIVVVLCIAAFTVEETKILIWPGITLIKSIDIPGTFIERWEGILMAVWIVYYFTTFINFYYFSSEITKKIFNFKDIKISCFCIIPFIYIIALYPKDIVQLYKMISEYGSIMFLINLVLIPIILFIISYIKKKGGENAVVK